MDKPNYTSMLQTIAKLEPGESAVYYTGSLWFFQSRYSHELFIKSCQVLIRDRNIQFVQRRISEGVNEYSAQRGRHNDSDN